MSAIGMYCTKEYDASDVKYIIDEWSNRELEIADLKEDLLGYKVRLITKDEYFKITDVSESNFETWLYSTDYKYWTMTKYDTIGHMVLGAIPPYGVGSVYLESNVVHPVITINKSALN